MKNSIVIFETYYGTSKSTANVIANVLEKEKAIDVREKNIKINKCSNVIFVFAFHGKDTAIKIKKFIERHKMELKHKNIAFVGVGLRKEDLENYLNTLYDKIYGTIITKEFVNGELRVSKLTKKDKDTLKKFLSSVNMILKDMGRFNIEEAYFAGIRIKELLKKK